LSSATICERCAKEEDFYNKYMLVVFLWEDRHNDPKCAIVKVVDDLPSDLRVISVHFDKGGCLARGLGHADGTKGSRQLKVNRETTVLLDGMIPGCHMSQCLESSLFARVLVKD